MLRARFLDFEGDLPWTTPVRHIFVGQVWSPFDAITSIPTASQQHMAHCEAVVSQALMSDEGKLALAMSMCEPVKISLEYQAIGRKILMVDELPQGALPRYERGIAINDCKISTSLPRGRIRFVDVEEEM